MKTLIKTKMPNGQTAIACERGMVCQMESGYQKTRDDDAEEIVRRCNAFPELVAAMEAAVQYLETHRPKGNVRDIFSDLNAYENGVMKPARAALAKANPEPVIA